MYVLLIIAIYSDSCVEKTLISYSHITKKCDICGMIQIETIFDILVKGFIIGVVVSAPLGPVGVLCIQRTLNKGRWYGFVTGLGASLSDIAYALLTGYGMSFVFDYINKNIVSAEATTENVTSGVTADGDTVILDYSGKLDGEAFSGGTATDTTYTIGSGNFISDLDKGLVGLTVGQEYDIPCTFPDNYTSDLAGKSVIFTVKVTAIQKTTYPEITDEWVVNNKESLNLSGDTVADFREEVRKIVEANANDTYLNNTFTSAYQIISENIGDVNYPQDEIDSLVEVLNTNIESEFNTYGSYYGISDLDTYKKSVYGFDSIDAFNEYATSSAQQYLLQKMIVTIIAADNDIHVSEDEINSYGNDLAQYYGYDDFNAIVDAVGSEVVSEIGYEILYQKVVEFECSQITEVEQ